MGVDSKEEMEKIQKNLEQFLDEDIESCVHEDRKNLKNGCGRRHGKKRNKIIFFLLLCFVLLFCSEFYRAFHRIYQKMQIVPIEQYHDEQLKKDGVINILLIGSDSRTQTDEGRSDAMILLSVSKKTKSIQMISLLRDIYVEIPGHDGNRLNAAYSFGGPELLLETVRQNFNIDVSHYIVVNFQAFANLVDAVGGVSLDLSNDEVQWVNAYLNEYNLLRNLPIDTDYLDASLSGEILLNGPQALAYCRNRSIGTDFGRTDRQRKVLSVVMKKIPAAFLLHPKEMINGIFPNLTTNLSKKDCLILGSQIGRLVTYRVEQSSIPVEGSFSNARIRNMAVLEIDFDKNRRFLMDKIYGK